MKSHFLSGKGIISFPTQKSGMFAWRPDQTYLVRRTLWMAGRVDFDEHGVQRSAEGWYRNGPTPARLPDGTLFVPPGFEVVAVFDDSKLAVFTGIKLRVECKDQDDVQIEVAVKAAANTNSVLDMVTLLYGLQHTTADEFFGVMAYDCIRPWAQMLTADEVRLKQGQVSSLANNGWKKRRDRGYLPSFRELMVGMGFKDTTKLDITSVGEVRRVKIADEAELAQAVSKAKTSGAGEGIASTVKTIAGDPGVQSLLATIASAFGGNKGNNGPGGGTP